MIYRPYHMHSNSTIYPHEYKHHEPSHDIRCYLLSSLVYSLLSYTLCFILLLFEDLNHCFNMKMHSLLHICL